MAGVSETTTNLGLIKFLRGHSVRDIDIGENMDLIDAAVGLLQDLEGVADYIQFTDDFIGATPDAVQWSLNDTSTSGTPTQSYEADETAITLALDNTSEAQVCGYDFGDKLQFDIDDNPIFTARFKVPTITTNEETVIGMGAAWNDTLDSNVAHAWLRLKADMNLLIETDDGTNDESEDSTVNMTADTYLWVKIDFSDTSDVLFYTGTDGTTWVARAPATFDMSNYAAGLQPLFGVLKASGTSTPSISVDVLKVKADRP